MTQRLDIVKMDKVRDPKSTLVTNGPEAQKENKRSSPDKIRRLHLVLMLFFFFRRVVFFGFFSMVSFDETWRCHVCVGSL